MWGLDSRKRKEGALKRKGLGEEGGYMNGGRGSGSAVARNGTEPENTRRARTGASRAPVTAVRDHGVSAGDKGGHLENHSFKNEGMAGWGARR